jgi:hypothetical protein
MLSPVAGQADILHISRWQLLHIACVGEALAHLFCGHTAAVTG